jgi:hypothetical protein
MIRLPYIALILGAICANGTLATAAENSIVWKSIGPNLLESADRQTWSVKNLPSGANPRSFEFFALRFHLGYYRIRLLSVADFAQRKSAQIAKEQAVDEDSPALFQLGVRAVFRTNAFADPMVAVAPAGFVTSSQQPTNFGLLKIDGQVETKLVPRGALTAIVCLNNAPTPDYQYQVPTFFRTADPNQTKLVDQCRDEVQTGPRIIEDPSVTTKGEFEANSNRYRAQIYNRTIEGKTVPETVFLGISEKEAFSTPYLRAALVVDDPGRFAEKESSNNYERDLARNAYVVVTTKPATLWDLQDMLSSPEFYANERYAPHWAVNLPGDDYATMIHVSSMSDSQQIRKDPVEVGIVDRRQASVLVVTKRP